MMHSAEGILYYLHIPKTAGTTLRTIMASHFARSEVCPYRVDHPREADRLERELARGRCYRFIVGHHGHDIRGVLGQTPRYATMLRQPSERALSVYRHVLQDPNHRLHREARRSQLGIIDIFNHPTAPRRLVNRQVHQLAGTVRAHPEMTDADALEIAKERLADVEFFGLTERFDESLVVLCLTFGWPMVTDYTVLNEAGRKKAPEPPTPTNQELAGVRELNAADEELYEHARKLFEARVAKLEEDGQEIAVRAASIKAHRRREAIPHRLVRGAIGLARSAKGPPAIRT